MQSRFTHLLIFAALATAPVFSGPVPITNAQLGYQANVQATVDNSDPNVHWVCPTGDSPSPGCGGQFYEKIGAINNATIWCVDSQLDVSNGETYNAYIESLNAPAAAFDNGNIVRYGSINSHGAGAGQWTYDLSSYGLSSPDLALTRYEMAAILITQYVANDASPLNNTENQAIQNAIWRLTENSVAGTITGDIATGHPLGTDWIAYAASVLNSNSFNFASWAVVSGAYDAGTGHLLTGSPAVQTFLVQVTPEPRFYGLLLAGLLTLFGIIYRRRLASE